jgi:signal transduction histidine kinase
MESTDRLLVIDDEQGIREGCRRVLEPEGYRVETAGSLAEARERLAAEVFGLVLLDVMLPDGRGVELLEEIRRRDADTVVAIITGYATVELAVEAIQQGAYDFLSKPFNGDVLLLAVRQGLERRRLAIDALRVHDVERQSAELSRAREEMERLDRFKSDFMLTVAHELRSPVSAAQSLLRTLLHGLAGDLNDRQRDILRRMEARNAELLELVNDLLSLAASKTYEPDRPLEEVRLSDVLKPIIARGCEEAQAKGVELTYRGGENTGMVRGTAEGLAMIFGNLIGNAVKYTPAGGRVEVEAEGDSRSTRVRVVDTGIGIPAEELGRLGEEFFRAGNAKASGITGSGLGLSIVRHNLSRFGGEMDIQSQVGQGTTITVSLPQAGPKAS